MPPKAAATGVTSRSPRLNKNIRPEGQPASRRRDRSSAAKQQSDTDTTVPPLPLITLGTELHSQNSRSQQLEVDSTILPLPLITLGTELQSQNTNSQQPEVDTAILPVSLVTLGTELESQNPTPQRQSGLGKRRRADDGPSRTARASAGTDEARQPPTKRRCRPSISSQPEYQLCNACTDLPWGEMDSIAKKDLKYTWKGRPFAPVGDRFRKLEASNNCTLCHQLHASWIDKFFDFMRYENPKRKGRKALVDKGDAIHIFPHMQDVNHITNFQSGRKLLRLHDTYYHIAVVPIAPGWKYWFEQHMATRGMVVVVPDDRQEKPKILQPQQIPQRFETERVLGWVNTCREHHKERCDPTKTPCDPHKDRSDSQSSKVPGMRVIDCRDKELPIRDYHDGDDYIALSYVWGAPLPNASTTSTDPPAVQRPRDTNNTPRVLKLPKEIPLTIRDAIKTTRLLGYRYLWVDKYCIDQNDPKDQEAQFSRMGDIYAGSQVAIFALGDDSEAGLPGVSSTRRLKQQECRIGRFRFVSTMTDPHELISQSKWSTRGWTYQEGLFSTRRLFFTNEQVYFECNAMNTTEVFKSHLPTLHINSQQRLRAFHRAGRFVVGNSTGYSHLGVQDSPVHHRRIDILRQCQLQITEYTKRELTNKNDILNAWASGASFYANTSARIVSLAGIPILHPLANLPGEVGGQSGRQEALDHLSYALGWTHAVNNFDDKFPKPKLRNGFPSWSWAGWFGEAQTHKFNLPFCWTSLLSSVEIGFKDKDGQAQPPKSYHHVQEYNRNKSKQEQKRSKPYFIRQMLNADTLSFDAYVLDPLEVVKRLVTTRGNSRAYDQSADLQGDGEWDDDDDGTKDISRSNTTTCGDVALQLSIGPTSIDEFREKLRLSARLQRQHDQQQRQPQPQPQPQQQRRPQERKQRKQGEGSGSGTKPEKYYQIVVIGTHGEPRPEVFNAIKRQDKKRTKAKKNRIELMKEECDRPEDIVCLVVLTDPKEKCSYRSGLLRVRYYNHGVGKDALYGWDVGEKRRIVLR